MSNDNKQPAFPPISGTVTARPIDNGPLAFQLSELCENLLVALCQDVPPRTRERHVAALYLIAEFFKEIGFPLRIYQELIELAHALSELDRGTVRDFLRPFKVETRPMDSSDIWQARAHVAIAVETMKDGGFGVREGCRRIAECFPGLKDALAPNSKAFASVIGSWHSGLSNATIKDSIASDAWRQRADLIAKYRELLRRDGSELPDPQQIALVIIQGALVLAGLAARKSERTRQPGQHKLNEARLQRAFVKPPKTGSCTLK
jgi:hypothetical protein